MRKKLEDDERWNWISNEGKKKFFLLRRDRKSILRNTQVLMLELFIVSMIQLVDIGVDGEAFGCEGDCLKFF